MSATALLERIRGKNIFLSADGERIRYQAPKGALTPELRQEIKDHKNELLDILQDNPGNHDAEIQRRADLFKAHLNAPGPSLFFEMPGVEPAEGTCVTCGEKPPTGRLCDRCDLCIAAARIVLQVRPKR